VEVWWPAAVASCVVAASCAAAGSDSAAVGQARSKDECEYHKKDEKKDEKQDKNKVRFLHRGAAVSKRAKIG